MSHSLNCQRENNRRDFGHVQRPNVKRHAQSFLSDLNNGRLDQPREGGGGASSAPDRYMPVQQASNRLTFVRNSAGPRKVTVFDVEVPAQVHTSTKTCDDSAQAQVSTKLTVREEELQPPRECPLAKVLDTDRLPVDIKQEPEVYQYCRQKHIPVTHVSGYSRIDNPHWKDAVARSQALVKAFRHVVRRFPGKDVRVLDCYGSIRTKKAAQRWNKYSIDHTVTVSSYRPIVTNQDMDRQDEDSVPFEPSKYDVLMMNDIYTTEWGPLSPELIRQHLRSRQMFVWIGHIHIGEAGLQGEEGVWYREGGRVVAYSDLSSSEPYIAPSVQWMVERKSIKGLSWTIFPVDNGSTHIVLFSRGELVTTAITHAFPRVARKTLPVPRTQYDGRLGVISYLQMLLFPHHTEVLEHVPIKLQTVTQKTGVNVTSYQANALLSNVQKALSEDTLFKRLQRVNPQMAEQIVHGTKISSYVDIVMQRHAFFRAARGVGELLAGSEYNQNLLNVQIGTDRRLLCAMIYIALYLFVLVKLRKRAGFQQLWTVVSTLTGMAFEQFWPKTWKPNIRWPTKAGYKFASALGLVGLGEYMLTKYKQARIGINEQRREEHRQQCAGLLPYEPPAVTTLTHIGPTWIPKKIVNQAPIGPRPGATKTWEGCAGAFTPGGSKGSKDFLKITGFAVPFYMPLNCPENMHAMIDRAIRAPPLTPEVQAASWAKRAAKIAEHVLPFQMPEILIDNVNRRQWAEEARDSGKRKLYLRACDELQKRPMQRKDGRLNHSKLQPKLDETQFGAKDSVRSIMNVGPIPSTWFGPYIKEVTNRVKFYFEGLVWRCGTYDFYPAWGSGRSADALSAWINFAVTIPIGSVACIAAGDDCAVVMHDHEGNWHFWESDFSMYDQTQSYAAKYERGTFSINGPLAHSTLFAMRLGLPSEIAEQLLFHMGQIMTAESPSHPSEKVTIDVTKCPLMPSGAQNTTFSNTVNTLTMWWIVIEELCATRIPTPAQMQKRFANMGAKVKLQVRESVTQLTFLKGIFYPARVFRDGVEQDELIWGLLPGVAMKFGYAKKAPSTIFHHLARLFGSQHADERYIRDVANTWRDAAPVPVVRAIVERWADNQPLALRKQEKEYRDPATKTKIISIDFTPLCDRYLVRMEDFESLETQILSSGYGDLIDHPILLSLAMDYDAGVERP